MSTGTRPATPPTGTPSDGASTGAEAVASPSVETTDTQGETGAPGSRAALHDPAPSEDGSTVPPRPTRFRPAGLALAVVGVMLALPLVASGAWSLVVYSVATWHRTPHAEPVAPVVSLVADGAVEIAVDPGATQVSVQADAWYAWDWQAPTYEATSTGDRLEIRHRCGSFPVSPSCEAGLRVVLPPQTQLWVHTGNGHVTASDLTGPVDVSSDDGRVELSRISGDVVARSGNGRVEVADVTGTATVTSNDGAVVVTGVDGDVLTARSGNGSVEVVDVTGSVSASSDDGQVRVSGIGGDVLTARSGNGRVEVSDVRGSVSAVSRDGAVVVDRVDGDVGASSGNGRVEAVSVVGSVTATSDDGAVLVEDVLGNVTARSGNGEVVVYGTGVPVALDISSGNGRRTVQAATDPTARTAVVISSDDGAVSYLSPRGPSRVTPPVPDVVGLTQQEAQAALEGAGLGVQVAAETSADASEGQVLRTDPPAGGRIARGTVVTLVVAAPAG